jgi:hypothetical protein
VFDGTSLAIPSGCGAVVAQAVNRSREDLMVFDTKAPGNCGRNGES